MTQEKQLIPSTPGCCSVTQSRANPSSQRSTSEGFQGIMLGAACISINSNSVTLAVKANTTFFPSSVHRNCKLADLGRDICGRQKDRTQVCQYSHLWSTPHHRSSLEIRFSFFFFHQTDHLGPNVPNSHMCPCRGTSTAHGTNIPVGQGKLLRTTHGNASPP